MARPIKQVEEIQTFLVSGSALSQEQVEDRMMLIGRGTKEKVQYLSEAILRKEITEILQDIGVTDHAAGMNPYYRPAK